MTVVSGHIHVSYGQYYLMGIHFDTDEWDPAEGNGLIFSLDEPGVPAVPGQFAIILTGTNAGRIRLTQELRPDPPVSSDFDDWEEVAEVSLRVEGDEDEDAFGIGTVDSVGGDTHFPVFTNGDYRVRVHARGRAANTKVPSTENPEEHLIIAWPAPPESESVLKRLEG
ncbi:hypothetical protein [Kineosporia succinea]|uniref:Uncharacterized protein n=1 Tax=Kineosporia succinea TaxID=84632 RepID=A0ABT9NX76_9ACTN|nr:hypothetical protein [Kineosporia succinea]MDP9825026.1 hypothetical protein [Kineosporia succinea]